MSTPSTTEATVVAAAAPHRLSWSVDDFKYHLSLVPSYDDTTSRAYQRKQHNNTTGTDSDHKSPSPSSSRLKCDRPDAALRVAYYYINGMNGTMIDTIRGLHYAEMAAASGGTAGVNSSCALLGDCYARSYGMSRPLMDVACALWRIDLAQKKSDVNLAYGGRYSDGWADVADNTNDTLTAAAGNWLIPATSQQWHAQMMAGYARLKGTSSLKADATKAAPLFEQGLWECRPAAEHGNVWAMMDLANSYADALGQPCDPYVLP